MVELYFVNDVARMVAHPKKIKPKRMILISISKRGELTMNYGSRDIFDLQIYDSQNALIAEINTLNFSRLQSRPSPHIYIEGQLLNLDFLRFIGTEEKSSFIELLKGLLKGKAHTTIFINNKKHKKCKLIAKTYLANELTGERELCVVDIPNARLRNEFKWDLDPVGDPSKFGFYFEILPFNSKGDLFKIKIKN